VPELRIPVSVHPKTHTATRVRSALRSLTRGCGVRLYQTVRKMRFLEQNGLPLAGSPRCRGDGIALRRAARRRAADTARESLPCRHPEAGD